LYAKYVLLSRVVRRLCSVTVSERQYRWLKMMTPMRYIFVVLGIIVTILTSLYSLILNTLVDWSSLYPKLLARRLRSSNFNYTHQGAVRCRFTQTTIQSPSSRRVLWQLKLIFTPQSKRGHRHIGTEFRFARGHCQYEAGGRQV
jgi:hypothetical protein